MRILPLIQLGADFSDPVKAAIFPQAKLRYLNKAALEFVGLKDLTDEQIRSHFWNFRHFADNLPEPLAMRYHGHQFMHYNDELGDGRGFTFAQFLINRILFEFGTKGSGQTPYSRSGDGRLTLKGAVREALCTELLETRGVLTSKTVCFFETGEALERGDEPSPTRSAVLTRLSRGHIRIGSFQRAAFEEKPQNILKLRDYCLENFYPDIQPGSTSDFFAAVMKSCTDLVASYMAAGFVHGVLNTDNINVSGESFDYGPYRFLPHVDPEFTAAYFDRQKLYAYGRQPSIFHWNLQNLAACLAYADADFKADPAMQPFKDLFAESLRQHVLRRLNLRSRGVTEDQNLVNALFTFLEDTRAVFEQVWFDLHSGINRARLQESPLKDLYLGEMFQLLNTALENYEVADIKRQQHPARVLKKPCDLLIDEIEAIWAPIAEKDDWSLFDNKIQQIRFYRGL